jgi:hypothetical protein
MPTQHDSKHEELDYTPAAVPPRARVTGLNPNTPAPTQESYPDNFVARNARMHPTTFEYLKPSDEQLRIMNVLRFAAKVYSEAIENFVPDGPDKTFVLRNHRANAMWVNVAVTRLADGTPRP